MISAPSSGEAETMASVSAEYTSPHGSQPQTSPNPKACVGDLTGRKRRPRGSI